MYRILHIPSGSFVYELQQCKNGWRNEVDRRYYYSYKVCGDEMNSIINKFQNSVITDVGQCRYEILDKPTKRECQIILDLIYSKTPDYNGFTIEKSWMKPYDRLEFTVVKIGD